MVPRRRRLLRPVELASRAARRETCGRAEDHPRRVGTCSRDPASRARRTSARPYPRRRGLHHREGAGGLRTGTDSGHDLRPDAMGRGRFRFRASRRSRGRGYRPLSVDRERDHGGQSASRRVESHQEEGPLHGPRLQDGHGPWRGHVRDIPQAHRVEPPAPGRRHAFRIGAGFTDEQNGLRGSEDHIRAILGGTSRSGRGRRGRAPSRGACGA